MFLVIISQGIEFSGGFCFALFVVWFFPSQ